MLALFKHYGVKATWATVGMLMCKNFQQWQALRPTALPGYKRQKCSSYALGALVQENPKLFFARPLVEQILDAGDQELASHTYSHFFCGEEGVTPEQFAADLKCGSDIGDELGITYRSIVFPCNQISSHFLAQLPSADIDVYRGNPDHWLYREGHFAPGGIAGRAVRFSDAWLPLTGDHAALPSQGDGLVNVPASLFLRPWSRRFSALESLRLHRLKGAMTTAARTGRVCHLWWHPHNFGVNLEQNIAALEVLLRHYLCLKDMYGMTSVNMSDFASMENE